MDHLGSCRWRAELPPFAPVTHEGTLHPEKKIYTETSELANLVLFYYLDGKCFDYTQQKKNDANHFASFFSWLVGNFVI